MPDSRTQDVWREIGEQIAEIAAQRGLEDWEAFRDWAFREVFMGDALADNISDTDVTQYTRIDGPDDFEVDGFLVNDEENIISLFQAKHRERYTERDLRQFLGAPERLLHRQLVDDCSNTEVKHLHSELVDKLPASYSLRLVAVTSGGFDRRAGALRDNFLRERSQNLPIDGRQLRVVTELETYDRTGLADLVTRHKAERRPTKPEVELTLAGWHVFTAGGYKTLSAHVPARDLIAAFRRYEYAIFDQNPRLWLGSRARPYLKMADTLRNRDEKQKFHLLNNGLSALCEQCDGVPESSETGPDRGPVRVRFTNFQIVNGCQTTVFLYRHPHLVDDSVFVSLRVTETVDPNLGERIAETTNTQTGLKAQDFKANDRQQQALQEEFRQLSPSWFYESRTGTWNYDTPDKRPWKEDGTYRYLTIKDVAQAALAFVGMPGEAVEDTRTIFDRKEAPSDSRRHYEDAFPDGIRACQLLLPAKIQRAVGRKIKGLQKEQREPYKYGELQFVWLIGDMLRELYTAGQGLFLPVELSGELSQTMDEWFDRLFHVAADTLADSVDDASRTASSQGARFNQRNFYRDRQGSDAHRNIRLLLDRNVDRLRRRGEDPMSALPRYPS